MIKILGVTCGILMPFFNIPLIIRILRRRSSDDISLVWAIGAWVCVMGMLPSSLKSPDLVLRYFGVINGIFFTGVFASVLYFHTFVRGKKDGSLGGHSP